MPQDTLLAHSENSDPATIVLLLRSTPEDLHQNNSAHFPRFEFTRVNHQRIFREDDAALIVNVALLCAGGIQVLDVALLANLLRGIEEKLEGRVGEDHAGDVAAQHYDATVALAQSQSRVYERPHFRDG